MEDARRIFYKMVTREVVSYYMLIARLTLHFPLDRGRGKGLKGNQLGFTIWDNVFHFIGLDFNGRLIETTPMAPISCNLNPKHMCSIEIILGRRGMSSYVIHGPLGTG